MRVNLAKAGRRIEALPRRQVILACAFTIVAIGAIDHFSGPITTLTVFYLMPVAVCTWIAGRSAGNAMALLASLTWAVADRLGPYAAPRSVLSYWNDASMLVVFVSLNFVLGALRQQLDRERVMLQSVQRNLMPRSPAPLPGLDVAWRWEPAWTVAGDYYDVVAIGDGVYAMCVADVSGKGMAAALIMSNVQATVHAFGVSTLAAGQLASRLNRMLLERLNGSSFVTMCYVTFDARSGALEYFNAGHCPPLRCTRDLGIETLEPTGPVLGIIRTARYESARSQMNRGDVLVLYSDGVTEYESAQGEQYGTERLRAVIRRSSERPSDEICEAIVSDLQAFGRGRPYNDDVTMLVVRRA